MQTCTGKIYSNITKIYSTVSQILCPRQRRIQWANKFNRVRNPIFLQKQPKVYKKGKTVKEHQNYTNIVNMIEIDKTKFGKFNI